MSKTSVLYKDIAPGAAEAAVISTEDVLGFCSPALLTEGSPVPPIATLEWGYWGLTGQHVSLENQAPAFWSDKISRQDGTFEDPPVIDITFSEQFSSLGITLLFDTAAEEYCNLVHVDWYRQDTLLASADFAPNTSTYYCQKKVIGYSRIVITLNSTWLPSRYAKLEQIIFGTYRPFGMSELREASVINEMNPIAMELPISSFNWTLKSWEDVEYMFQLKQPVEVRNNDSLIGVYYIDSSKRSAKSVYQITCSDALGVLDSDNFTGGIYQDYSAKQLLQDIVGDDFLLTFELEDKVLAGVILPSTKREAIQQVLFAWGACASTDGITGIRFFSLPGVPEIIGENRVFRGATAETAAIVTEVQVTAHTYTQAENGGIDIGGIQYNDTKTVYTVTNPNVTASDKRNVVTVENATLISPSIGAETAQRVYEFYLRRNTHHSKIVWDGENLGDCVTIPTPWESTETGNILKTEMKLSNTVVSNCEVLS